MQAEFLRLPAVLQRYALGRTTIYDLVAKSEFPCPIHVGRSSLWSIEELARFDQAKLAGRKAGGSGAQDTESWSPKAPGDEPEAG
jgi:predicted DNA-binding transcriptional regulator AlpA